MHITSLRKVGGSVMLAVPPALLDVLDLVAGNKVALVIDNGRLVMEPQTKSRYTLHELFAQCDPSAVMTVEERIWFEAQPVGEELL